MKVAVYGQYYKSEAIVHLDELLSILEENDIEAVVEKRFYSLIQPKKSLATFSNHNDLDNSFDLMITVGGDGTFLRAVTFVRNLDIPIIGINTGRLGFLATIQKDAIETSVKALLLKQYEIKERTLLCVETTPKNKDLDEINFALNEVSVVRSNSTSMITVDTFLDKEHLTAYWADGLIIATPTGSTGYSLSCGGPVITPETKSLVLTPIAPHNLNARPLVIPDNTEIKLRIKGREKQALVSLDSRRVIIDNETEILVKKAPFTIKIVQLKGQSFLKTLREKLLWGEDKRN